MSVLPTSTRRPVVVGSVVEFDPNKAHIIDVEGKSVGIFNIDGSFYAVSNVCPHALGPICRGNLGGTFIPSDPGEVEYGLDRFVLQCSWHGWEFDIRTGASVFGADSRRLSTFPVSIDEGNVVLWMRSSDAQAGARTAD